MRLEEIQRLVEKKAVCVIPAFEVNSNEYIPLDKSQLLPLIKANKSRQIRILNNLIR
jgi:hypothetical protein